MKHLLLSLSLMALVATLANQTAVSYSPGEHWEMMPSSVEDLVTNNSRANESLVAYFGESESSQELLLRPSTASDEVLAQSCCKICRKGKACGNSCISRSYTCRKPPGCACNGD